MAERDDEQEPNVAERDNEQEPPTRLVRSRLTCPECGKVMQLKDNAAGEKVRCPACEAVFISEPKPPPPVPLRMNLWASRWIIAAAGFCILSLGILVVVLANQNTRASGAGPGKDNEPEKDKPLTEKQKAAAADAIRALGRIEAAVQVGVNYRQYSQLLIDVKAVVNEAEWTLPTGKVLTNLREAMRAYKDAATVWDFKIEYKFGLKKAYGHGALIERYKLPLEVNEEVKPDVAMQLIWVVGAEKLAEARMRLSGV
jgi:hypothetical protein